MRCPALLIAELRMPVESVGYCDGVSTSNVGGACDSQVSEKRTGDNGVSRASSFSGEKWMREQKKERHSKVARIGKLAKAAENTDERERDRRFSINHSLSSLDVISIQSTRKMFIRGCEKFLPALA